MEIDPEDKLNINVTSIILDPETHDEVTIWYFTRELLKFTISVVSIVCNILIIFASVKLKKLNKPKYFYVFNLAIINIIYLILSPYVDFLATHLLRSKLDLASFTCITIQTEKAFMFYYCLFLIILLSDWLINKIIDSNINVKYNEKFLIIKIILYILIVVTFFYNAMYCFVDWHRVHPILIDIIYLSLIFFVVIINGVRIYYDRFKQKRLEVDCSFLIPTLAGFLSIPFFIIHYLAKVVIMPEWLHQMGYAVCEVIFDANAIVNVFILSKCERGYKEKFLLAIECQCREPFTEKIQNSNPDQNGIVEAEPSSVS